MVFTTNSPMNPQIVAAKGSQPNSHLAVSFIQFQKITCALIGTHCKSSTQKFDQIGFNLFYHAESSKSTKKKRRYCINTCVSIWLRRQDLNLRPRSVKKMCRWHIFSVGRRSYAPRKGQCVSKRRSIEAHNPEGAKRKAAILR